MPAKLDLLPRKEFEITLENGTVIKGKYGTWALKRFTQKKGVGLSGLYDLLAKIELDDVVEFILCAVEQSSRESGVAFNYTDVDACGWIDEMGGIAGGKMMALFNHYGAEENDEKKSDPLTSEPHLNGTTSNELQPVLV